MKKFLTILLILICLPLIVSAQPSGTPPSGTPPSGGTPNTVSLPNPLTGKTSFDEKTEGIPVFLGKIINAAMGIIGSLALVMFIYGGAVWMLSRGNDEQVKKGKSVIIWATLGLAIIFTAYALIRFVILALSGATTV